MYTLGDISKKSAISYPDYTATVFEGTRLTYRELDHRVNRLANALMELGYQKGQRLAVLAENSHKYLEVYFAAAKLGMSVTPLNFRLSDAEIEFVAKDSEAVGFLAADGYEERAGNLKGALPHICNWVSLDRPVDGFLYYEDLLAAAPDSDPGVPVDENELAILMYTGGTTGLPKGVMMSHRNVMTALISAVISSQFSSQDATCFVLPLFHVSFWPALTMLMVGGKVVINRKADLNGILQLIQDERCTHINAVPTVYGWLLQLADVDAYDLSSLRSMTYAGSPFPPEVLKQCIQKFGNIFSQGYGMTEALGATGLAERDHVQTRLLSSAGKAVPCADVSVFDQNDQPAGTNDIGEIVVRGRHVMMGYWKNPELTEKVLRGGWYHTGDMGYLDEKGYLFLVDRKADMIVTGGENVYPKEVEDVLYQHPAVLECAVVSAPDDRWGERVQAVVVLKSGETATVDDLMQFCRASLGGYKCPKAIEFWASIPKTPVGKILRKDIKKTFWEGHDRSIG